MAASIADCRRLLGAVEACDATPPPPLVALVESYDAITSSSAPAAPVDDLVKAVIAGKLRGTELDKRIAAAATAAATAEFRRGLAQRTEVAVTHQFVAELKRGTADIVIDSVRKPFDTAAAALVDCAKYIDPSTDAVTFLEHANDEERYAWGAIKAHTETVSRIAALVTMFGAKSMSFPMIELPVQLGGTGFLHDAALMCVDSKFDITQSSQAFSRPGVHRQSPWFLNAATLRLNSISEARETVRRWAEVSWESLGLNTGRGVLDPEKGFVATPIPNPYAKAAT